MSVLLTQVISAAFADFFSALAENYLSFFNFIFNSINSPFFICHL